MRGRLYASSIPINQHITLYVPTVGQIVADEDAYFAAVCPIVATPRDMMLQLHNVGIDYTTINEFELFCMLFSGLQSMNTHLVFGDLDLTKFQYAKNTNTNEIVLRDEENDIVIDRILHDKIATTIREMLNLTKNDKRPGNEEAKRYELEKEKRRAMRKHKKTGPSLEDYIIALVNTEQFPYNYETVLDISIIQFYASLQQISHKIQYDNTMIGLYAGTVKYEDIPLESRTWIQNLK